MTCQSDVVVLVLELSDRLESAWLRAESKSVSPCYGIVIVIVIVLSCPVCLLA